MRLLTNAGANIGVAWTPDGSKIALSSYGGSGYDSFVKDVSGSSLTQLTTTAGATDRFPSWSPDGSQIAFHSDRSGTLQVYVMNADGSGLTRLTNDPTGAGYPNWGR